MTAKLTLESAAATLALVGVSIAWSAEFEAYRVAPIGADEHFAEYAADLGDAWEEGREMADLISREARDYARAFHVPATAARAAALATFR